MAGALGDQDLAVDEQGGIVQSRGRGPRYPLGHRDDQQPGQEGGGDGVDDQDPARAKHPARFPHSRAQVRHVLEDLAGADHVGAAVGQRQDGGVGLDRRHAVLGRLDQRGPGEVHPDQPVPQPGDVRGEQAGPQPTSISTAPGRAAGGTRAARACASQCSMANVPRGSHH